MSHFVYIYRDKSGKARYVGYGENSARALSHMTQTHNQTLAGLLANQNLTLEIAGPFDSKETGLAIETALISAITPDANIARGHAQHRFRPLGVPPEFAKRIAAPPLSLEDLQKVLAKHKSPYFLCVKITNEELDERLPYDPTNPPDNESIVERMVRYWPLARKREAWIENPAQSPTVLLAIYGSPGAQFVIAAAAIDCDAWKTMPDYEVPLIEPHDLDVAQLRGRRIAREAGLKFNLKGMKIFP